MDFTAALGTRNVEHAKITGNRVVLVPFGAIDNMAGDIGDTGHEFVSTLLAALDLAQLEFPVAGQLRLGEFRDPQTIEQFHQRKRFGGRNQILSLTEQILLADETIDDRGARGRRAKSFLTHRLAQLFVLYQPARSLHGTEQGRFRETRWGLGL